VVLPDRDWAKSIPVWAEDSVLRVTGICSVQLPTKETVREGLSVPSSFRILLRSPDDVTVLNGPPWWTANHVLPLLAAVLAITLCALGWVAVLRHRISEQAAVIQQQNATLKDLSFQDGLTGIANRRKFDETLEAEFERATRTSTPLSLLMLDIDHFKSLNDQYGHQCGDECLVRVANALKSTSLRAADLVARYGGEEFAVILPGCEEAGAIAVAESMRIAVLDLAITDANSPFNQSVSISVGAATILPGSGESAAALVGMADAAMYDAKLSGRNRTCLTPTLAKGTL
jgi:diguanylate cyclase (GGDEF)-like protein